MWSHFEAPQTAGVSYLYSGRIGAVFLCSLPMKGSG